MEAICSEEVDEVCRRKVEIYVFEAEKCGEQQSAFEKGRLLLSEDDREDEQAVHGAIVLKVDMVDDEQSWREKNSQGGGMCSVLVRRSHNESMQRVDQDEL